MSSPTLRLVCAWCRVIVTAGSHGAATSYGMCPRCASRIVQGGA